MAEDILISMLGDLKRVLAKPRERTALGNGYRFEEMRGMPCLGIWGIR